MPRRPPPQGTAFVLCKFYLHKVKYSLHISKFSAIEIQERQCCVSILPEPFSEKVVIYPVFPIFLSNDVILQQGFYGRLH